MGRAATSPGHKKVLTCARDPTQGSVSSRGLLWDWGMLPVHPAVPPLLHTCQRQAGTDAHSS